VFLVEKNLKSTRQDKACFFAEAHSVGVGSWKNKPFRGVWGGELATPHTHRKTQVLPPNAFLFFLSF